MKVVFTFSEIDVQQMVADVINASCGSALGSEEVKFEWDYEDACGERKAVLVVTIESWEE